MSYDSGSMPELRSESLWVVMPVFNEEASIERVFAEWLPVLRGVSGRGAFELRLLAINDGSRDSTLEKLRAIEQANPDVTVQDQANAGHGAACVAGYRRALASGAAWVLQIDSDGQCDPRYFPAFWEAREGRPVIFGYRTRRDDGWSRWAISRVVSLVTWLASGTWVGDANVPYRLMRSDALDGALQAMPADFHQANILLALRLQRACRIAWIPIRFRERHGGTPSIRAVSFVRHGVRLYRQLLAERERVAD